MVWHFRLTIDAKEIAAVTQADVIQDQNDRFRQGDDTIPGTFTITQGVSSLLGEHGAAPLTVIAAVTAYDDFSDENDPNKEHDFGAFELFETPCFWKIDLYNQTLDGYSPAPADLSVTVRVLTVMLASEY